MEEKRRRECDSNSSIEHLLIGPFDLVLETRIAEACDSDVSQMKKVNKQCLLDTPRTVRVREKTCQVIVQTSRL